MKRIRTTLAALALFAAVGLTQPAAAQDNSAGGTAGAVRDTDDNDGDHGKWGLLGLLGLLGLAGLRKKDNEARYTTTGTASARRND